MYECGDTKLIILIAHVCVSIIVVHHRYQIFYIAIMCILFAYILIVAHSGMTTRHCFRYRKAVEWCLLGNTFSFFVRPNSQHINACGCCCPQSTPQTEMDSHLMQLRCDYIGLLHEIYRFKFTALPAGTAVQ